MSNIDRLYSPLQQEVLKFAINNDFFMLINHGAKRSGKTIIDNDLFLLELKRVRAIADVNKIDKPQYILAGADLSSLKRNVLIELSNKYGIEFKFDNTNSFYLFGVRVCCFGHSKINDLGRIRGMTAYGAYINEATVANKLVFDEIVSRCSGDGARIIMDTNPDRPSHWLKTDYIDKPHGKDEDSKSDIIHTKSFRWRLTDNTFLTDRYIEEIKEHTPSGMLYERNINGAWVAAEGVVYPDFDRNVHYIKQEQVPKIVKFWGGLDFGWEHFGAFVLIGEDKDGVQYLLKEVSDQHTHINTWAKIIKNIETKTGKLTVYCDSARPDSINDLQCSGIRARNAHKEVIAGIGEVATRFKSKTLFVVRENVDLFDREIDAYAWKEGMDEPIKTNDDVMDAVRYAIYSNKVDNETSARLNTDTHLRGGF